MQAVLITVSGVLTVLCIIPYVIEILRGKTKPRIVSWFTWTLLTGIACAASFSDGQVAAGVLMACATLATAIVVVLGLKYGDRHFERTDIVCQVAALVGLVLWFVFDSPAVAVIAAVTIDLVGCIPTIKHSWKKPHEETWITFALAGVGGVLTLTATGAWAITAVAYPLYIVLANGVIVAAILRSPHRSTQAGPSELRQL